MSKVRKDDLILHSNWCQVLTADRHTIRVNDLNGQGQFEIHGKDLVEQSLSADHFDQTERVSMTDLAEQLVNARNVPITVVFEKKDGSERKLRGRLLKPEPLLGRSYVEDLDIEHGQNRKRLVDHRTIKSLIVLGVKYELK